jgi:hypothetical protein
MKTTAKSTKPKVANHPNSKAALRGGSDTWWMKDLEMLAANTQTLLEKMRDGEASPVRTAVRLLWAQAEAAAEKLGFDTSRKDWMKIVHEESNSYSHTQAGIAEEFWRQIPMSARVRIRALELIGHVNDLAKDLECHIQETENWLAELRALLTAEPAQMPLLTLLERLDDGDQH